MIFRGDGNGFMASCEGFAIIQGLEYNALPVINDHLYSRA